MRRRQRRLRANNIDARVVDTGEEAWCLVLEVILEGNETLSGVTSVRNEGGSRVIDSKYGRS